MQITLPYQIGIPIALIAGGFAIAVWYYMIKPVPIIEIKGRVQKVEFQSEVDVTKTEIRSVRHPELLTRQKSYHLPNRYLYTVQLENGLTASFFRSTSPSGSPKEFTKGDQLVMTVEHRKIPFYGDKIAVKSAMYNHPY